MEDKIVLSIDLWFLKVDKCDMEGLFDLFFKVTVIILSKTKSSTLNGFLLLKNRKGFPPVQLEKAMIRPFLIRLRGFTLARG